MPECTSSALADSAACFTCVSPTQLQAIRILLLCNTINGTPMNCDASTLLAAAIDAGYTRMSPGQSDAVEVYLLCSLSNNSSGGLSGEGSPVGVLTEANGVTYWDTLNKIFWVADDTWPGGWYQLVG